MRFKTQQKNGQMPDVNLVPMMDVLMTILTFFIIISMTLSTQQRALNVTLPNPDAGGSAVTTPDPMLVVLNTQGQIIIQGKTVTDAELARQIETYLSQNPQGAVLLKADRKVEYEQLANLLSAMQNVGGDRVSLAIDSN
jgi:biopolymer transport protein ExbD